MHEGHLGIYVCNKVPRNAIQGRSPWLVAFTGASPRIEGMKDLFRIHSKIHGVKTDNRVVNSFRSGLNLMVM